MNNEKERTLPGNIDPEIGKADIAKSGHQCRNDDFTGEKRGIAFHKETSLFLVVAHYIHKWQ